MSFSANISCEGYAFFREEEAIDFDLLERKAGSELAGSEVAARLRDLMGSKLPVTNPELLMRIRNSKKFHVSSMSGVNSQAANKLTAGMVGLTAGLSAAISNKTLPVLKEKHLPEIKQMILGAVTTCGLNSSSVVVIEARKGSYHLDGRPDLVPSYQFLAFYIKPQYDGIDFEKIQKVEQLRHQEKMERLAALNLDAQVQSMSHVSWGGGIETAGIKITRGANKTKEKVMHEFAAAELLKKRNALVETLTSYERQLLLRTEAADFTLESTAVRNGKIGMPDTGVSEHTSTDISLGAATCTSQTVVDSVTSGESDRPSLLQMPEGPSEVFTKSSWSDSKKRNESLAAFKAKFKSFITKSEALVTAVQRDYKSAVERREARAQLQKEIHAWSAGGVPFSRETSAALASYAGVQSELDQMATANESLYADCVLSNIVDWQQQAAMELKTLVKEHKCCIQQLEHYEQKVDGLLDVLARLEARGQRIPYKTNENLQRNQEKLDRNKGKLVEAKKQFLESDKRVRRAEEVVDYSWMVLCPLILELMKLEVYDSQEIAEVKTKLHSTICELTEVMKNEGLLDIIMCNNDSERNNTHTVWCHMMECGPTLLVSDSAGRNQQSEEYAFALPRSKQTLVDTFLVEGPSSGPSSDFGATAFNDHHDSSSACTWFSLEVPVPEVGDGETSLPMQSPLATTMRDISTITNENDGTCSGTFQDDLRCLQR